MGCDLSLFGVSTSRFRDLDSVRCAEERQYILTVLFSLLSKRPAAVNVPGRSRRIAVLSSRISHRQLSSPELGSSHNLSIFHLPLPSPYWECLIGDKRHDWWLWGVPRCACRSCSARLPTVDPDSKTALELPLYMYMLELLIPVVSDRVHARQPLDKSHARGHGRCLHF